MLGPRLVELDVGGERHAGALSEEDLTRTGPRVDFLDPVDLGEGRDL